MKREKLDEHELDTVSGGAFNFYTKDGANMVYVDGIGTYNCNDEASAWIVSEMSRGANVEDLVNQSIKKGLFWK